MVLWFFLPDRLVLIVGTFESVPNPLDRSFSVPLPQANLCLVDIDGCSVQVPEDLPSFPNKQDLVSELRDLLTRFGVLTPGGSHPGHSPLVPPSATLGRNLNNQLHHERTANVPFPRRKLSWSLESGDSGVSSTDSSARSSYSSLGGPQQLLQHSEAYQRIAAVARKAGKYAAVVSCIAVPPQVGCYVLRQQLLEGVPPLRVASSSFSKASIPRACTCSQNVRPKATSTCRRPGVGKRCRSHFDGGCTGRFAMLAHVHGRLRRQTCVPCG